MKPERMWKKKQQNVCFSFHLYTLKITDDPENNQVSQEKE